MAGAQPLWMVRAGTVPYRLAWDWQRALVARRAAGELPDVALLLEHPHVYTIGKRGRDTDVLASPELLAAQGAEVVRTDRGGQVTYHGPGQLVGYLIVHLGPTPDVWGLVGRITAALAAAAADLGVAGARVERGERTGVWVGGAKLAAIGMRVTRGVTMHGFALNCTTDLARFQAIVPCGLPDAPACSLSSVLGRTVTVAEALPPVERRLAEHLGRERVPADLATLGLVPAPEGPGAPGADAPVDKGPRLTNV